MTYEQANLELRSRLRHLKARMDAIVDVAEAAPVDEDRIEIIREGLDDLTSRMMVGQEAVRRQITRRAFRLPEETTVGLISDSDRIRLSALYDATEREADAINNQAVKDA